MKFYRNIILFFFIAATAIQLFVHEQKDINVPLSIDYGKASSDLPRSTPIKRCPHSVTERQKDFNHGSYSVYVSPIKSVRRKSEKNIINLKRIIYIAHDSNRGSHPFKIDQVWNLDGLKGYLVHFMRC